MANLRLKNTNPLGDVDLPIIGRIGDNPLRAGEEFDCPADVAGRAPGGWREPTADELADDLRGLETREVGEAPDIRREVKDIGAGLLAQVGNYVLVKPTSTKQATGSGAATGQEN